MKNNDCPSGTYMDYAIGFCKTCANICDPARGLMRRCARECPEIYYPSSSTTHHPTSDVTSGFSQELFAQEAYVSTSSMTSWISGTIIGIVATAIIVCLILVTRCVYRHIKGQRRATSNDTGSRSDDDKLEMESLTKGTLEGGDEAVSESDDTRIEIPVEDCPNGPGELLDEHDANSHNNFNRNGESGDKNEDAMHVVNDTVEQTIDESWNGRELQSKGKGIRSQAREIDASTKMPEPEAAGPSVISHTVPIVSQKHSTYSDFEHNVTDTEKAKTSRGRAMSNESLPSLAPFEANYTDTYPQSQTFSLTQGLQHQTSRDSEYSHTGVRPYNEPCLSHECDFRSCSPQNPAECETCICSEQMRSNSVERCKTHNNTNHCEGCHHGPPEEEMSRAQCERLVLSTVTMDY